MCPENFRGAGHTVSLARFSLCTGDALAGQQISLRGQVDKYNDGILGWDFIHIQDGSGDAANGDNDLTVTNKDATAVGETVVLTGTTILNKDFGAGYSFPVLMEDASITAE